MNEKKKIFIYLPLLLSIQFLLYYHLRFSNTFVDEGEYVTTAWLVLRGHIPYLDFFIHHAPGVSYLVATFFKIFGAEFLIARLVTIFFSLATTTMVFAISYNLFGDKQAILSSIYYIFMSIVFYGFVVIAEPFSTFFRVVTFLLVYWYFFKRKHIRLLLLCGIFLGIDLLIKQTALWTFLASISFTFIYGRLHRLDFKVWSKEIFAIITGFLISTSLVLVYFFNTNALNAAIYGMVIYNLREYGPVILRYLFPHPRAIIGLVGVYAIIPLFVLRMITKEVQSDTRKFFLQFLLLLWLISSFMNHFPVPGSVHVTPSLPFVSLIFGYVVIQMYQRFKTNINKNMVQFMKVAFILFLIMFNILMVIDFYLNRWKVNVPELIKISSYVNQLTQSSEKVYIYPIQPLVFFLSKREPASRHFIQFPWTSGYKNQREAIADLKQNDPRIVVYFEGKWKGYDPIVYAENITKFIFNGYEIKQTIETENNLVHIMEQKPR